MTSADDAAYTFRTARAEDTAGIADLDGSFTTSTVFRVAVTDDGFTLRETSVHPPLTKVFPDDEPDDEPHGDEEDTGRRHTVVAVTADGELAGFAAVSHSPWNRRLTVEDIEVAPAHRGRGVGRQLMCHAAEFARERGATHIWLEVTNVNAPAIHAYRAMGFSFCGLDTTLYEGTASQGEQALYMSRPCP
ncbi:GNAT family N-acetyltransferase [Streptantibioticus cattleyicolor]|uniref:Streptothricin acetyltransferase n=1 Tax=Streptantibioticus cattleyicolor (strain ATCC 35852 / DSM 46488 / JCM 4925 / NBRC 14057 / NRRL 8057) TaxID=1003195 RepID=F8JL94_STREN|nr:GNAT family N-acetyltransferase [Streptantibioticus cattleyicolor]AEW99620.1 streptothricin acetyltransferase [Streptantibioticus cattleyicolor NRRL 8057 = DSM 46488]CCB71343.1 putative acetyltransferase [Streptantibioticus cattleyicolor NRRL 8057 = DSM 46488]